MTALFAKLNNRQSPLLKAIGFCLFINTLAAPTNLIAQDIEMEPLVDMGQEQKGREVKTPQTLILYYSYLNKKNKRKYDFLTVNSQSEAIDQDIFAGGFWHKVTNAESTKDNNLKTKGKVYVVESPEKAQKLLQNSQNYLEAKLYHPDPKRSIEPRLESVRVSQGNRYNGLAKAFNAALSYFTRSGYPVVVKDEEGFDDFELTGNELFRLDAHYNKMQQNRAAHRSSAEDLTKSMIHTDRLSKPVTVQIYKNVTAKEASTAVFALLAESTIKEISERVGNIVQIKMKRFFYESKKYELRNVADNEVATERLGAYVATKRPEMLNNFLDKIGVSMNIDDVHPSINWALKIIRIKIEHLAADMISEKTSSMISLVTEVATKKALFAAMGFSDDKINQLIAPEQALLAKKTAALGQSVDSDINKMMDDIKDPNSALNKEVAAEIRQQDIEIDAGATQFVLLSVVNDLQESPEAAYHVGGINLLRKRRFHETPDLSQAPAMITARDVADFKLAQVKLKIFKEIHSVVNYAVEEGLKYSFATAYRNGMLTSTAVSAAIAPFIGPGTVIVLGGLTLSSAAVKVLADADIYEYLGSHTAEFAAQYVKPAIDNSDFLLPPFARLTERDENLLFVRGDYEFSEGFGVWNLIAKTPKDQLLDETFVINEDNPNVPTVKNYVVQLAQQTKQSILARARNFADTLEDGYIGASEFISRNFGGFLRYFSGAENIAGSQSSEEEEDDIFYDCRSEMLSDREQAACHINSMFPVMVN